MSQILVGLQVAIELAFALLAIKTIVAFIQERDRRHGYLALALGALAVDVIDAQVMGQGGLFGQIETDISLISFLLVGYGLVMFRDTFVPYQPRTRLAITSIIAALIVVGLAAQLPARPEGAVSPVQSVAIIAILAVWAYCLLDPTATFWLAARGRPAVEKARLRAISLGCLSLLVVVVFGTVAGSFNPFVTAITDIAALAIVPLLYVAFFPPVWMRRLWRQPDEDQLRLALHDLLQYSPDRKTLAQRALVWAERLVGGDAAFVVDSDGSVLATRDIANEEASAFVQGSNFVHIQEAGEIPWRSGRVVVVPLVLQGGPGAIVIMSGRLSTFFGDDEMTRLRQYAISISAGLDRVLLSERVAALERAKSDFLSIASHELRGPMTVIKGYLTMIEAGAMGEISSKAQSILPLLISKSDEVNWMVEQMIEAARLEEGRLALKKQKIDLVELTDIAIDSIKLLLGNHKLNVDQPQQAIEAEVDPDRFQIVVRNLLSNAAKYSPSGSDIDVKVRRDGTMAFLAVRDCGVGISKEDQVRLFTRFNRIESHAHVQGTGLGLWLSREIALMHDGDLMVQSEEGQGSTFTLTVPLAR